MFSGSESFSEVCCASSFLPMSIDMWVAIY